MPYEPHGARGRCRELTGYPMTRQQNDSENTRRGILQEGSLADQIANVLKNFGKPPAKNNKQPSRLEMLSLPMSLPPRERLEILRPPDAWQPIGILRQWNNNIQILSALNFANLKALPAKIVAGKANAPRLHFLRFGRLSEQLRAVILHPMPASPPKEGTPALPGADNLRLEAKQEDAAKNLPANAEENPPACPENTELWRYEMALGRNFVKNSFLNEQGHEPDVPYSIPAFFPTHQWINITLDEGQWLDDKADGEWNYKRIATRPVDL